MPLPIYREKFENRQVSATQVVAVAAGKGGVGKSTVTVNLARALAGRGFKVGILDADIYGPSLRRMLPEERLPSQKGEKIFPALSQGIFYISMAHFRKDNEAAVVRAPVANGVIQQFINGVEWGALDYLLVDFPPGTGDIQLTLAQKASFSGAILVTTPQAVAVMDVRKAAAMFAQVKIPILGVVENMSFYLQGEEKVFLFGREGGLELSRELGVPFLGQIPIENAVSQSGDEGTPLSVDSGAYKAFVGVSDEMIQQLSRLKGESEALAMETCDFLSGDVLRIQWKNHGSQSWNAATLQRHCPCAGCQEGKSKTGGEVKIKAVSPVGRYAIKIEFINGCSAGIFDFEYLKTIQS